MHIHKMPCKQSSTISRYDGMCSCGAVKPRPFHKKLLTRAIESFYDNCAAYNLRYIPYRTQADGGACLKNALKDLFLLACFFVANTIVLLTILSKLAMHLCGVVLDSFTWIKKNMLTPMRCCDHNIQKRLLALIDSESAHGTEKLLTPPPRVVE